MREYVGELITEDCDEAIRHGPPDGAGKCPFCDRKIAPKFPAPKRYPVSELTEQWGLYYDPDWDPWD